MKKTDFDFFEKQFSERLATIADEVENADAFCRWYAENSRFDIVSGAAVADELWTRHCETGSESYELKGSETKSGNPETYNYTVEYSGDVDEDTLKIKIVF